MPWTKEDKLNWGRKWRAANPDKVRQRAKKSNDKRKHSKKYLKWEKSYAGVACRRVANWKMKGVSFSFEDFLDMLVAQRFKCAICGVGLTLVSHMDHDHATYQVRGILCSKCNHGLGNFRDNVEFLLRAAAYLNKQQGV